MFHKQPSRLAAILIGLSVAFLWATSWVLIKWGLKDIPPLIFAGSRYGLAFLVLLPFMFTREQRKQIRSMDRGEWLALVFLGIFQIAVTQGAQFLALKALPAVAVSLVLNLTPLFVTFLGIAFLAERPNKLQWLGIVINLGGVLLYFLPFSQGTTSLLGLGIIGIGLLSNSLASIIGRKTNRERRLNPLTITTISLGIGAALMLVAGFGTETIPRFSTPNILAIVWLAVVNTAVAFTAFYYTQQTLTAMESSILNGTIMIYVPFLAWLFLHEMISWKQIGGIVLAMVGTVLVQLRKERSINPQSGT
jgi:drug/metabolite transporter (DMT)-like permease